MEISNEIIKVLDYIGNKFGLAIDFTSTNVLPYLQTLAGKYIKYKIATDLFWIAIFSIFILAGIVGIIYQCKDENGWKSKYDSWGEIVYCPAIGILSIIVILALLVPISICVYNIIVCSVFPEKVLFEYMLEIKNKL